MTVPKLPNVEKCKGKNEPCSIKGTRMHFTTGDIETFVAPEITTHHCCSAV